MFKTPALGASGLGNRGIGAPALKRMARSDQQQGAFDLRDAQAIFAAEPALLGGIWLPDLDKLFQSSNGTTAAVSGAVVGYVADRSGRGLAATQATTANKPTLVRFQNDKYWFTPNSTTTALTATFPSSLGSTCTIFEAGINGVVKRTNRTIATTYNLADKPWFGSIVLNRATTPYEDALFTRLLSCYSPKYQYNDTLSQWLFQSQEKGLILDCDDLPLMFQDASGVTPVTAMEQSVRLILDKSPNRVFARAESDAARPVVSARYNILLATEALSTQNVTTIAATYTLSFSGTGTITLSGTATGEKSAGSNSVTCTAGTLTLTVSGSVTQADLRVTNDGAGLPPYQRVTTATDYDTAGFPRYLKCNGAASAMVTPTIDFTATDKMTVWAGVRKMMDIGRTAVIELSAFYEANNGSFLLSAPSAALNNYVFLSGGAGGGSASSKTNISSPTTNVLTCIAAISTDVNTLRVDGVQAGTSSIDQGLGNYGNYPLYIGARAGSSHYFNGRIYSLIVRGAQTSAELIAAVEQDVNYKTRAY